MAGGDGPRVLLVSVGERALAIPADATLAVVRAGPVTPVGGVPAWVIGVTAVRGRVMAVADLARLAGAAPADGADAWLVVVERGAQAAALAGLAVRRVVGVTADGDDAHTPRAERSRADAPAGLPIRGAARLALDDERGVAALPPWAPVLDVPALLDLIHDDPTRNGA